MQAQNLLLAAQNELLIQQLREQRVALKQLRRENTLMMNPGSQLSSLLSTTIQSTIEQTLKVSSMSEKGGMPLEVRSYDGTLGMHLKNFKNKLLNELNRPNSSYANMKYSFMYSKASGDFLQYLASTNFESEDSNVIITRLDGVFRGTTPRLDANWKLEE